jgi:hypothetical protein
LGKSGERFLVLELTRHHHERLMLQMPLFLPGSEEGPAEDTPTQLEATLIVEVILDSLDKGSELGAIN